jgi:hypothetical protein
MLTVKYDAFDQDTVAVAMETHCPVMLLAASATFFPCPDNGGCGTEMEKSLYQANIFASFSCIFIAKGHCVPTVCSDKTLQFLQACTITFRNKYSF